jgi:hypothetical protein
MERRSGKRSSSVGSEKIKRVGDRQGQSEKYCSTGQSPQPAVAPTEEEDMCCTLVFHYGFLSETSQKNQIIVQNSKRTQWKIQCTLLEIPGTLLVVWLRRIHT